MSRSKTGGAGLRSRYTATPTGPTGSTASISRTHHVLDIENLAGAADCSEQEIALVAEDYRRAVEIGPMDQITIGCSHFAAKRGVLYGWGPGPQFTFGSGPDGADLALLQVIESEELGQRFDRVVIGSGDGIFALPCAELNAQGVEVTVVAKNERSLSSATKRLVTDVRYLEDASTDGDGSGMKGSA